MSNKTSSLQFARNVVANWSAFLYVAGISFFLTPFIVHSLGEVAYGVWTLLVSLVGYLGLVDFGVRGAVTRYVAHHHAANRPGESSRAVSAGILLFGLFGLLAVICAAGAAVLAPHVFNIPAALIDEARIVILLGGLNVAIALVGGVFGGVVAGLQRFDVRSGIEILTTTVRAGAVLIALSAGYGLITLALIQLLSSILVGSASWVAARRLYPEVRPVFRGPLKPEMRILLSFGAFSSLIHISGVLIYYSDSLVIAAFLPIGLVTFYAIATSLCNYAGQVVSALSTVMTPRISALEVDGGRTLAETAVGIARIATLVTTPIAMTFYWRGESFVSLWIGSEYGAKSGEVLRLLAAVVWLGGIRSVLVATIMGVNKHRFLVPGLALESVCNLLLSILLVGSLGLAGVALGTLIPSLVVTGGYLPYCLRKTIGVRVAGFYRDALLLPTVACIPFALATALVEQSLPAKDLTTFFIQVAMLLPLVPAIAMTLCLTPSEKVQLALAVRKAVGLARKTVMRKSA